MATDSAIPLSLSDLRRLLSQRCEDAGSMTAWARKAGVSVSQVSEAINAKRDLSATMIAALGYIQVTRYVPVRRDAGRG